MNHTPASGESIRLSGAVRPCCGYAATLAEQPSLASLTSELADSALLGYLRHRRFAAKHRVKNPVFAAKRKNTAPRMGSGVLCERAVKRCVKVGKNSEK